MMIVCEIIFLIEIFKTLSMSYNEYLQKKILPFLFLFLFSFTLQAQFTITENFKGSSVGSNIILGGNPAASLTSGVSDPVNNGWLRLTSDATNQRGFAYINTSFPSSQGIYIEFDYKTWRSRYDSYNGADGFSVFLFNAATPTFSIGAFGGSLGYAQRNSESGLAGGWLGIGFDEYGNYAINSEGKKGGMGEGVKPNSIVLRGPAAHSEPYRYLAGKQLQTSAISNGETSIDYNTTTSTRPTDANFFRRVKIYIEPIGTPTNPKYRIRVIWRTSPTGSDIEHINYETTDAIPTLLKMGFAASTGGGFNYHEVRNLMITTTGGVRVQKEVDKDNALPNENLTYTIKVQNETMNAISNLVLTDTIKDGNGNAISLSNFQISSITFNNNGNSGNTATGYTSGVAKISGFTNPFTTTMQLAGNSNATFTIVGKINSIPTVGILKNSVGLNVSNIGMTDPDLTNNYSSASTIVLNPNVDLKIEKGVDNNGIALSGGNSYTIVVSNLSSNNKPANASKPVSVTDVIPAGLTFESSTHTGWTRTNSGNTYTFTRTDALNSQYAYPPITIVVKPTGAGPWTNTANLTYADDTNSSNNSSSALLHWKNFWKGTTNTDWSLASNWTANMTPSGGDDVEFATTANNTNNGPSSGAAVNDLQLTSGKAVSIGNLTNASDKNLKVAANASITVNGVVSIKNPGTSVNSTNPDKIQIGADATLPNGTFIFNCPAQSVSAQPDIYATVALYAKGFKGTMEEWTDNVTGSPTIGQKFKSSYHWQHFGVPVASIQAEPTFYGSFLRQYFENKNGTIDAGKPATYYAKWIDLNNSSILTAFDGFEITQDEAKTYFIPGKLLYCDKDITLTRKAPAVASATGSNIHYGLGQNIFGNSFTSAINIDRMVFPNTVEQTVFLYNTGRFKDWTNGSLINNESQRAAGNYLAIPVNAAPAIWENQIPSMQGFLLKFKSSETTFGGQDATVTLKYTTNGVTTNSKPQLSPEKGGVKSNNDDHISSLHISLESKSTRDDLWLISKEGTTPGFDNGWDGRKFFGTPTAFIYTESAAGPMQVNANESLDGTVINLHTNSDTEYTLTLTKRNLDNYSRLHLLDLETGKSVSLDNAVSYYQFKAKKQDITSKRFVIVNSSDFNDISSTIKPLYAYAVNNQIKVTNYTGSAGSMSVYNLAGQKILEANIHPATNSIAVDAVPGVYFVKLQAGGVSETVKILLI